MNSQIDRYKSQTNPLFSARKNSQQSAKPLTGPLPKTTSPVTNLFNVSGLYTWKSLKPTGLPQTAVLTPPHDLSFIWGIGYEALRLDVDGHQPQMTASGTIKNLFHTVHWLAELNLLNENSWAGTIVSKTGASTAFPYTHIQITAVRSIFSNQRKLNITFMGHNVPDRHSSLNFESPYFQKINLTLDFTTSPIPTTAVANARTISLEEIFQEAGFDVTITSRKVTAAAPHETTWSDQELHDAMQFYWANSDNLADPALWAFFTPQHQSGTQIGAIIYDNIGPTHGQGTAVFTNSFITQPPANLNESPEWLRFSLTCRQISQAIHLPLRPSHLNSPTTALPTDYLTDYFHPEALQALRHTTLQYTTQGGAPWYDEQGFTTEAQPPLQLELRVNRERPIFEFMEPVILELELTNTATHPQWIDKTALTNLNNLTLIIKKEGQPAQQFHPYQRAFQMPQPQQLPPGQSLHDSLFISAGLNGWEIAAPGEYTLHAALVIAGKTIISQPLHLHITPPTNFVQEHLAQDFFADDVGRILAFNGSRFFSSGNQVLTEVMARLPLKRISLHAAYALGSIHAHDYKQLALAPEPTAATLQIITQPRQAETARHLIHTALLSQTETAVTTFGHIRWRQYMEQFSHWLAQQGDLPAAAQTMNHLYNTLVQRTVNGRQIPPTILTDLYAKRYLYHAV